MRTSTCGSGRPIVSAWSSGVSVTSVWVMMPCSSVWPNEITSAHPKVCFVRVTSAAGTVVAGTYYLDSDSMRFQPRVIEVGPATGNLVIVTSGLNEGERVVTDGHYKLARNAPVTITTPASLASGGKK